MSFDYGYYFGPYLGIHTVKRTRTLLVHECKNGHAFTGGRFCQTCGEPMEKHKKTIRYYPSLIVDHLIDLEWEDVLFAMYRTDGLILAKPNMGPEVREWLDISSGMYENFEPKTFPTPDEILDMEEQLAYNYADVLQALRDSPYVDRVVIASGFVPYSFD